MPCSHNERSVSLSDGQLPKAVNTHAPLETHWNRPPSLTPHRACQTAISRPELVCCCLALAQPSAPLRRPLAGAPRTPPVSAGKSKKTEFSAHCIRNLTLRLRCACPVTPPGQVR